MSVWTCIKIPIPLFWLIAGTRSSPVIQSFGLRAERAIKPFIIGRKNFLFCKTPNGARASAMIYSVVETAKANGLSPYHYLTYLFEKLPNIDIGNHALIDDLLPWSETIPDSCRVSLKQS